MTKHDLTDSEPEETRNSSSSEECRDPTHGRDDHNMPEYEKQRLARIAENKKRMEALGLAKIASSLDLGKNAKKVSKKRKGKVREDNDPDEDYKPGESSSDSEDGDEGHENSESGKVSRTRGTKKKNKGSKAKKKTSVKESSNSICGDDDDEVLRQALELSLRDSAKFSDAQEQSALHNVKEKNVKTQDVTGGTKRKKLITSRVQMSEDELIMIFYSFDESWKGGISVSDLKRVAAVHDFTWSDEELRDMINCFDSDGDEKLSLEDFGKIVSRCNMIKGSITS